MDNQCIVYRALRDIKAGEELCINYGKLWFTDADDSQPGTEAEGQEDEHDNELGRIETFPLSSTFSERIV